MSVDWKLARKKPLIVRFREVNGETEVIKTLEGELTAVKGRDFIIEGVNGELYPIAKHIFFKTYDIVLDKEAREKCPFHYLNGGECELSKTAVSYCCSWCHVRKRLKKQEAKK